MNKTFFKPSTKAPTCGSTSACASSKSDSPRALLQSTKAGVPVFLISTMDCAYEESEIRRAVADIPGVRSLQFQLAARRLSIDAEVKSLPLALAAIRKAGFKPLLLGSNASGANDQNLAHEGHRHDNAYLPGGIRKYAIALLFAVGAESIAFFAPDTLLFQGLGMVLSVVAIALAGFSTYVKGLTALRNFRLNINALMTVAVTGAFLIGQWPEAAMVMALYAIAELIEARAVDRARGAIKSLLDLTPETAEVRQSDGSWQTLPVNSVVLDAVVRVKPGARIPVDGVIAVGSTSVDQAPVTGESIPVDKVLGDGVFAGTINATATIEVQVTALPSNSVLSRIIHAVEQAQSSRAPTQQFVDKFAAIYTPAVFILALGIALLAPWLLDWTWTQAIYKALVLLVIACPCALVISTPVTVVSGLTAAARRGILIKGGVHLEGARKIKVVALDKTGTITEGKPVLVDTEFVKSSIPEWQVLRWAGDLASHSDHPVSKAIAICLDPGYGVIEDFKLVAGRGVEARVDGRPLILGNHRLIQERGLCSSSIEARLADHEALGRTVTMLATQTQVLAIFAIADTIRESSQEALAQLQALGVATVMLTGDNEATAKTIAKQAGINDARGNLLPEDKLTAIEEIQKRYGITAMIGDGINDAPALARSNIGFAMGVAGTDTAIEAADVVIMNDDLRRIPETILLSRKTQAILLQNIFLALGIKAVFLALALFNGATMWMAVFADMGASLLVVFNGLRLLRVNSGKKTV